MAATRNELDAAAIRRAVFGKPPRSEIDIESRLWAATNFGVETGGTLTLENDFFRRARQGGSVAERKKMIDPIAKPSVCRGAVVLGISRGSVYHKPRPVSDADLKRIHRIDRLQMELPFAGSRFTGQCHLQLREKRGRRKALRSWLLPCSVRSENQIPYLAALLPQI